MGRARWRVGRRRGRESKATMEGENIHHHQCIIASYINFRSPNEPLPWLKLCCVCSWPARARRLGAAFGNGC